MEERGRGSISQTRAETLPPTCSRWVWCAPSQRRAVCMGQDPGHDQDTLPRGRRAPNQGGSQSPRISEPKAPAGGGWGDQREGAALTI